MPWAKLDVQHADVKLLTILERVDPKTFGVEELLALTVVLKAGLAALGDPAVQPHDDGQPEWESDERVGLGYPRGSTHGGKVTDLAKGGFGAWSEAYPEHAYRFSPCAT